MSERIFCASCSAFHDGEVALDATGWPSVSWVEPHDPDSVALQHHRAAIVDEAAAAFAKAASNGDFAIAEVFLGEALDRNDPEEDS